MSLSQDIRSIYYARGNDELERLLAKVDDLENQHRVLLSNQERHRVPVPEPELVTSARLAIHEFERHETGRQVTCLHCSVDTYYRVMQLGMPWIDRNRYDKEPPWTLLGLPLHKDRSVLVGFDARDEPVVQGESWAAGIQNAARRVR